MPRRRGVLAACAATFALTLASVAVVGPVATAPPAPHSAAFVEQIPLPPGGKVTTTTVFQGPPATYAVTVTGSIVETNPPFGPGIPPVVCTFDAFYAVCTDATYPSGGPPSGVNPGLTAKSATVNGSLELLTRSTSRPAFRSDHSYAITLDRVDPGTLLLEAWPHGGLVAGVTYTGGLTVTITPAAGAPGAPGCAGRPATIVADPNDPLGTPTFGTAADDVILGTDSADQIFGRGGKDVICGGAGNDLILGNAGADLLFGDAGDDQLRGGDDAARDILDGDEGADRLNSGRGNDVLDGGPGPERDVLVAGPGDDELIVSPGVPVAIGDRLYGGTGTDLVNYARLGGPVDVDLSTLQGRRRGAGGAAPDYLADIENVRGTPYNDFLIGDRDSNVLSGGRGHDRLRGLGDRDHLLGQRGQDTLFGDAGPDDLRGGPDRDTCVLDADDDPVSRADCERRLQR
jgi:hypothetical protein